MDTRPDNYENKEELEQLINDARNTLEQEKAKREAGRFLKSIGILLSFILLLALVISKYLDLFTG